MTAIQAEPLALIVDDDPETRDMFADMLRTLGIRAMPILDPETVVDVAASHRPALIILDAVMPVMDGYTIATHLRGDRRTVGIPIIFMTGQDAPIYQTLSFGVGAVACLAKPFSAGALRAAVGQALAEPTA